MKLFKGVIINCLIFVFLSSYALRSQVENEYELKSAFLYNFTKYVEWENLESYKQFIINIAGDSEIKMPLDEIAASKTVHNRPIRISQIASDEISFCHILFIPGHRSANWAFDNIQKSIPKNTLVVSESPGALNKGSAINFLIVNDKIKFEINLVALERAGLKASSQLLKLAIYVKE